jgi:hypothetical protein
MSTGRVSVGCRISRVAGTSGIVRFFKNPLRAWQAWRRPPKTPAVKSGERVKRVSDSEIARCLFCGRTASRQSFTDAVQLDCSDCGPCEVTVEAMALLRADENLRTAVLRQMRRHLDSGADRPLINLEFIQSIKGRPRSAH